MQDGVENPEVAPQVAASERCAFEVFEEAWIAKSILKTPSSQRIIGKSRATCPVKRAYLVLDAGIFNLPLRNLQYKFPIREEAKWDEMIKLA